MTKRHEHFRYELGDTVMLLVDGLWMDAWVTVTARHGLGFQTEEDEYVEVLNENLHKVVSLNGPSPVKEVKT